MNTKSLSFLYKLVPFPIAKGIKFASFYKSILESQYYTQKELEELINNNFRKLLKYTVANVPFYKEMLGEELDLRNIDSISQLNKLPIMRKEDVRKHFKKLTSKEMDKKKYSVDFTSGSTGTSINIVKFKDSTDKALAFYWRYNEWAGLGFGDRIVFLTGMTFTDSKRIFKYDHNKLFLSAFHITKDNLKIFSNLIQDFKPAALRGYPSAIMLLTKYMRKNGIIPPKLKVIILTAECLLDEYRKEISSYWNCRIQNIYGQAENVVSIGECEKGNLHISSEFGYMELVDKEGKSVAPGTPGKIIGTGFTNFAMPFIRYDTRDVAVLSTESCSCGRSLPVVKSIEGRSEDIIVTPDGRMVGRLDAAFKYSGGIELSQILQDDPGSITVKIVRGENYNSGDVDRLEIELRKRLGYKIKISYNFVDNIERTALGKLRFVISSVVPEL